MNKKPMIITGIIFGVIIIALILYFIISLTTDLFKPTSEIFQKHLAEDLKKIEEILDFSKEEDYINTLIQSNYKEDTKINLKYINDNFVTEDFDISVNGITNNNKENSYRTVNINCGENEVLNLEYLQENKTYGILFKDIVKQFISIDINNKEEVLNFLGIDKENVAEYDLREMINKIKEKKQDVKNLVLKKIDEINTARFTTQKSIKIALNNGEEKIANVYSIKLTQEEIKELILELLRTFEKQKEINRINNEKIQFPDAKIDIYVSEKKAFKTVFEIENNLISMDFSNNEVNVEIKRISEEESNVATIDIKREDNNTIINYADYNRNFINVEYSINKEENKQDTNFKINIKNDFIKGIDLKFDQMLELSDNDIEGIEKSFDNISNINIARLNENDRNSAIDSLIKKLDELLSNKNSVVKSDLINKVIIINREVEEQFQEIDEKLKKDFNNQFLPYAGQNIEKKIIYNLLDLASRNMEKYDTIGEDKYRISVSEGKENEKAVKELKEKIEKSNKVFNIGFEYDSKGKINIIKIQGYEKQE